VLSRPDAAPGNADAQGAEFLALSASLWSAASPAEAVQAIAAGLGVSA
jgi:thiamine-phosphate pyrophosphorylase